MRAKLVLQSLGLIVMTAGFAWLGSSIASLKQGDTIDVTGSAEKIVSMDSVELQITIDNKAIVMKHSMVHHRMYFSIIYAIDMSGNHIPFNTIAG